MKINVALLLITTAINTPAFGSDEQAYNDELIHQLMEFQVEQLCSDNTMTKGAIQRSQDDACLYNLQALRAVIEQNSQGHKYLDYIDDHINSLRTSK